MTERPRVSRNLERVLAEIATAADRVGRPAESVTLIAVTKYARREQLAALAAANCRRFGESRPQQLWQRVEWFPDAEWHLVGHLQRNKVARSLPLVTCIHSVDSERLLATIDRESKRQGRRTPILLQVNISRESAKHGWPPHELEVVADRLPDYPHVQLRGLMGMASWHVAERQIRGEFSLLRRLRDDLHEAGRLPDSCRELSMGMSQDYVIAVEEGATMVRVGSALFADDDTA